MEEWTNAAEFDAVVAKATLARWVTPRGDITSMGSLGRLTDTAVAISASVPPGMMYVDKTANQIFVGTDTASQIRFAVDPSGVQKQEKPMSTKNTKAFEVKLADGTSVEVLALTVNEVDGRITFHGFVEGVDEVHGNTVVRSFRAENVDEYRVIPKPERVADVVGKNTYRVNLADGSVKDVKADLVLFQAGNGDKAGRYSIVTSIQGGENRTEYIVGEDKVDSVERVTQSGEVTVLVDNKTDASA